MGISEESALGDFSGRVGKQTKRKRYDKTVVYDKCKIFHQCESEASKANRIKFGIMSKFAQAVKAFPELETIWRGATRYKAHAPINKIEQANAKYFDSGRPTMNNKIIPDVGFPCRVKSLSFNKSGIAMEIIPESIGSDIIPFIKNCSALIIIGLYDPEDKNAEYCVMIRSRAELVDCEEEKPTNFTLQFSEDETKLVSAYKKWILYFVLIVKDTEGQVLGNSNSFTGESEFSLTANTGVFPLTDNRPKVKLKLSEQRVSRMGAENFMLSENHYKNNQGENIFEFAVKEPEELVLWVISLGKGVEVLEPSGLRIKVKELVKDVLANYE